MSFRDRYDIAAPWIVVFVGLVLMVPAVYWLVSTEKYQAVYQQEATEVQRREAKQTFQQDCVDHVTPKELGECYKNAIETAREPERSERDLKAQEDMAASAKGALIVALLSFFVTVVGVMFVAANLIEAKETTKAAVGMNDLTRALETPWLGIRMPEGVIQFDSNGFVHRPIKFRIVNMGRSPAEIVEVARIWIATDGTCPPALTPQNVACDKVKPLPRRVASQSETEPIWANEGQMPAFHEGLPRRIFFQGYIRYRDAMKTPYIAGFCYFIEPKGEQEFAFLWPWENAEDYNYCREEE